MFNEMAITARAPKQWCLGKTETVNFFVNWSKNVQYIPCPSTQTSHPLLDLIRMIISLV